jgi:hypothetical protein
VVSTIPVRTDKLSLETLSVPKIDCRPRAVVSAKWEYSRTKPETFGDFHFKIGECAKSRDFRPIRAFLGEAGRTHEWVAGAGGYSPLHQKLKNDCKHWITRSNKLGV